MLPPDISGVQLSPDEVARFSRHLILPEVGMDGQKRLKAASVLCVGTGGLGSPLLLYLAAFLRKVTSPIGLYFLG